jgi:predicted permease
MEVLRRLGFLLALLAVGFLARQGGLLTERRTEWLTAVAFYVALPALVFGATYDRSLGALLSPALVAGVPTVILGTAAIAWLVARREPSHPRRSVAIVQSYHANLGFLGVPLVALTLGDEATAVASVVLGVSLFVHVPLTVLTLVAINDADASVRDELAELATNPVLVALVFGLGVSAAGLSLSVVDAALAAVASALGAPTPTADGVLGFVGEFALPLALLGVGASLEVETDALDPRGTGSVVALKVAVMPLLAFGVFTLLAASQAAVATAVLMFGMPSAVSTYVYANELGGDARFASVNVFATTVASLLVVAVAVQVLG